MCVVQVEGLGAVRPMRIQPTVRLLYWGDEDVLASGPLTQSGIDFSQDHSINAGPDQPPLAELYPSMPTPTIQP